MATTSMMSTMTNLIASTLSHVKARSTQVEFIHQPHIHWPHPLPTPHLSAGPGSITTIISDSGLPITVLKICPSTHQLLLTVLLPPFVHKAEILYVCCSSCWSAAHKVPTCLSVFLHFDTMAMAQLWPCMLSCDTFFAPDGDNSWIFCTQHVVGLADPQGESDILKQHRRG